MNFSFVSPWHAFLPRDGGQVIAFMGSGGKTTLQRTCARIYRQEARFVVLTTTTQTEPLPDVRVLDQPPAGSTLGPDLPPEFYLRKGPLERGKWQGVTPQAVDALGPAAPEHIVLVEVDGSAKRPVKLYRPGEPVWPGRTSLAVVVMGTSALAKPLGSVLYRWDRPALASPLVDRNPERPWTWEDQWLLLAGAGGYLDQVPAGVPLVLALTGLDELTDSLGLFAFLDKVMADPRLPLVLLAGLGSGPDSLRTVCRQNDGIGHGF